MTTTFDPHDPVSLTQALVRCESVTPDEGGAITLLETILATAGFTCHRMTFSEPGTPDVENLYARIGDAEPHVCFAGHTDVVPPGNLEAWTDPPFAAVIRDGILYGRGAVDMKGGVACSVSAALRHLASNSAEKNGAAKHRGSISFLITGDEEGPSINGTMKVLDWMTARGEKVSACLVAEPSNPEALGDEMKIGRRGSINGELIVYGRQGHSAYPQKAENPIPKLARIIDRLATTEIDRGTAHFQPSNLQTTVISVPNRTANVIPAEARATINIRYNDTWNRRTIETWLHDHVAAAAATVDARYDLSVSGTGDVFLTNPQNVLVETLVSAVEAETGRKPALTTGGGTSDARFIKDICPVIEFGLVNKTIHAVDEHTSVADIEKLTAIYERFLAGYFAKA
jgi:succinyl-diaminopimelate desuccinylase